MRETYITPEFNEESTFEVQARSCQKVPGQAAINFCGQVWIGRSGNAQANCYLNPQAKSS